VEVEKEALELGQDDSRYGPRPGRQGLQTAGKVAPGCVCYWYRV